MDEEISRIQKNNQYYDLFFENVKNRTDSRNYSYLLERFLDLMPADTCILDIGCGTGEHLAYFQERNVPAYGIEPSLKMRECCESQNLTVFEGSFETLRDTVRHISEPVGGIWCAASLLHVPTENLTETVEAIYELLEPGGVFFFTLRLGQGHKWDKYDDEHADAERFIQLFEEERLDDVLHEAGFRAKLKLIEESYWGRKVPWISYVVVK